MSFAVVDELLLATTEKPLVYDVVILGSIYNFRHIYAFTALVLSTQTGSPVTTFAAK